MEDRRPTLQDIADKAGMSRSGVSRALRNHPGIPDSTRRRVKEIAEKLGYRPNPMISALMATLKSSVRSDERPVLGYLTAHATQDAWRKQPAPRRNFQGAQRRAEQLGFRLEEFWLRRPGMTPQRFSKILYTRAVRGVILAPMPQPGFEIPLEWSSFAVSVIGNTVLQEGLHRARANHFQGMTLALTELQTLGYQRPGLFLSEALDERVSHRWAAAFLFFQQFQIRKPSRVPMMLEGTEMKRENFLKWFNRYKPDVVISIGSQVASWLRAENWRVPEDIGYVTLSHPGRGSPLSGVDQQAEGVGALSVDLVTEQLNRYEYGLHPQPKVVLIDAKWIEGKTVRTRKT